MDPGRSSTRYSTPSRSEKSFPCSPTPHRRLPPRVPDAGASPKGHCIDARPIRFGFSGTPRGFEQGFAHLLGALDGAAVKADVRTRYNIELVFEEIVGNIVRYGAPQGGELRVDVSIEIGAAGVVITIDDDGMAFDPCSHGDAVVLTTLADAPDGGFGLALVRHAVSSMRYERTANQRNRLKVTLSATAGP
jgi:serine/threonine-protein kinase RsbW